MKIIYQFQYFLKRELFSYLWLLKQLLAITRYTNDAFLRTSTCNLSHQLATAYCWLNKDTVSLWSFVLSLATTRAVFSSCFSALRGEYGMGIGSKGLAIFGSSSWWLLEHMGSCPLEELWCSLSLVLEMCRHCRASITWLRAQWHRSSSVPNRGGALKQKFSKHLCTEIIIYWNKYNMTFK